MEVLFMSIYYVQAALSILILTAAPGYTNYILHEAALPRGSYQTVQLEFDHKFNSLQKPLLPTSHALSVFATPFIPFLYPFAKSLGRCSKLGNYSQQLHPIHVAPLKGSIFPLPCKLPPRPTLVKGSLFPIMCKQHPTFFLSWLR